MGVERGERGSFWKIWRILRRCWFKLGREGFMFNNVLNFGDWGVGYKVSVRCGGVFVLRVGFYFFIRFGKLR